MSFLEGAEYSAQQVCDRLNISKKTLFKWEKEGRFPRIKRDWRHWRIYTEADVLRIRKVIEAKAHTGP